jgi:hypothetical protein
VKLRSWHTARRDDHDSHGQQRPSTALRSHSAWSAVRARNLPLVTFRAVEARSDIDPPARVRVIRVSPKRGAGGAVTGASS